ncbi:hypothetical protein GCM10009660_11520 [Catellatospora bangladeshensis]
MGSLFGQVWLWSLLSFVAGAALTWLVLVRPVKKELADLQERQAAAPRETPAAPPRDDFDHWHVEHRNPVEDLLPDRSPRHGAAVGPGSVGRDDRPGEPADEHRPPVEPEERPAFAGSAQRSGPVGLAGAERRGDLAEQPGFAGAGAPEHRDDPAERSDSAEVGQRGGQAGPERRDDLAGFGRRDDLAGFEEEQPRSLVERLAPEPPADGVADGVADQPVDRSAEETHLFPPAAAEAPEPAAHPEADGSRPRAAWHEEHPAAPEEDRDGGEPERPAAQTTLIPATALARAIAEVDGRADEQRPAGTAWRIEDADHGPDADRPPAADRHEHGRDAEDAEQPVWTPAEPPAARHADEPPRTDEQPLRTDEPEPAWRAEGAQRWPDHDLTGEYPVIRAELTSDDLEPPAFRPGHHGGHPEQPEQFSSHLESLRAEQLRQEAERSAPRTELLPPVDAEPPAGTRPDPAPGHAEPAADAPVDPRADARFEPPAEPTAYFEPPAPAPEPAEPEPRARGFARPGNSEHTAFVPWRATLLDDEPAHREPEPQHAGPEPQEPAFTPRFVDSGPLVVEPPHREPEPEAAEQRAPQHREPETEHASQHREPQHVEPQHVEPQHVEPQHVEPQHVEPQHIEPAAAEPTRTEPEHAEPERAESEHAEPERIESAHAEPVHAELAHAESTRVEPAHAEPERAESAHAEPAHTEPERIEPAHAHSDPTGGRVESQESVFTPQFVDSGPLVVEPSPQSAEPLPSRADRARPAAQARQAQARQTPAKPARTRAEEPSRPRSLFEPLLTPEDAEDEPPAPPKPAAPSNDQPFVPRLAPELLASSGSGLPQRPTRPANSPRTPPPPPPAPKPISPPPPRPVRPRPVGFSPSTGGRPTAGTTTRYQQPEGFNPRSPFGPGSVLPKSDGMAPAPDFQVKATLTGRRYFTDESANFGETRADVWFRTVSDAEKAGFRPAP